MFNLIDAAQVWCCWCRWWWTLPTATTMKTRRMRTTKTTTTTTMWPHLTTSSCPWTRTSRQSTACPCSRGGRAGIAKYKMLLSGIFWAYFFSIFRGFEEINQWWDYGKTENKFPLLNLYIEQLLVSLGTHNFEKINWNYLSNIVYTLFFLLCYQWRILFQHKLS